MLKAFIWEFKFSHGSILGFGQFFVVSIVMLNWYFYKYFEDLES